MIYVSKITADISDHSVSRAAIWRSTSNIVGAYKKERKERSANAKEEKGSEVTYDVEGCLSRLDPVLRLWCLASVH
jgi:hypothetical protein